MSQPKKAFNEVRAILGKLDRSREELRKAPGSQNPPAAVGTPPVPTPPAAPATFGSARPASPIPGVNGVPVKPQTLPPTPGSRFGRAQPIRPAGGDALGRWNPPAQ